MSILKSPTTKPEDKGAIFRNPQSYVGRFAPTPSGPLHFGSIIAALGSFLDARSHKGQWLVRIDDLDTPRVRAGADDDILRTLERLGLHWDGSVVYQSRRTEAYQAALDELEKQDLLYPCTCPRTKIKGKPYPGTCRNHAKSTTERHALRIHADGGVIQLWDELQGEFTQSLQEQTGDFIVRRSDNIFAYQLAVVVDDQWQGITHIVRGQDLLDTTPCQIYLQRKLAFHQPFYRHLPVAVSEPGKKISKQHGAEGVLLKEDPVIVLHKTLDFLGQQPDQTMLDGEVNELIDWAVGNWQLARVPRCREILV